MTNEEAIEILQEEHNYVQEPCYVMNAIKKAIEALQAAEKCDHNATEMRPSFISDHSGGANKMVDHVAEVGNMAQLTIEQMRDMGGKPYWHVGLRKDSEPPHWAIMDPMIAKNIDDYFYGERWIAYAYPPAHIDMEAWTPCEYCKDRHLEKVHVKTCGNGDMGISAEVGRVNREEKTGIVILQGFAAAGYVEFDFCPFCGRPQTSEARALLEKRLRG